MRTEVMGVAFDNVSMEEALEKAMELLDQPGPHLVVTPNAIIVQDAQKDKEFADIIAQADLVIPDGVGVLYSSRILGRPLKSRVPGVDLASGIMSRICKTGHRLFLLGAKPGVAEEAGRRLTEQYPGLMICGTQDGYFKDDAAVAEQIRQSGADVVFVCLGAPKQEKWAAKYGEAAGAHLYLGLGGSIDVFAGAVERAPAFWQNIGMEWLYRGIKEPKRLKRMLKLPLFLVAAVGRRIQGK